MAGQQFTLQIRPRCARMTVELTALTWEPEDESERVRAVTPLDLTDLKDLDASLQEWSSSADDEAFADL
jgi:hypothetical protein